MSALHRLPANPSTVHWGYFDCRLAPVLTVWNGDLVEIEAVTHHAGDAPGLLMDEGIERLFADVDEAMRAAARRSVDLLGSRFGPSRDDAYSLASVAVDFTVTQVVDGRQGVHGRNEKRWVPRWP